MLFSLSGLKLRLQDLPICLLSCLRSLERWDLSKNQLQELPQNLDLPALRYLDLSDNQLEDIASLESLQRLEELKMEDNLYITVRRSSRAPPYTYPFVFYFVTNPIVLCGVFLLPIRLAITTS